MKIAIAQIDVKAGQVEANYLKIKEYVEKAKKDGADLIVFSEMCVAGYFLGDRYLDDSFCEYVASFNDKIRLLSEGIGIIWGNLKYGFKDLVGRDGRKVRFNACFFAFDKEYVQRENVSDFSGYYIKHLNPDYRFFNDSRYFLSGLELELRHEDISSLRQPFIFKGHKIGLEICEDMWSSNYSVDISQEYLNDDIDLIVNISASPYTKNKRKARQNQISKIFANNKKNVHFLYVNNVGAQNYNKSLLVFDGNSTLYNEKGEILACCNELFKEEYKVVNLGQNKEEVKEISEIEKIYHALICGIRKFDETVFNSQVKWIIGLSGGLDSSVNLALLCRALGSHRIIGYNMATSYNSKKTIDNANYMANKLNVKIKNGAIEKLVTATKEVVCGEYGYQNDQVSGLTLENIQARIRGHLLSTFAQIENGVVINNGNKVEVCLGYCTLYGDSIGALSPLGDLTKVDLFELAHFINQEDEIIPHSLLPEIVKDKIKWEMPPSAELKDNQRDPMKWFYHDYLVNEFTNYPTKNILDILEDYYYDRFDDNIKKWLKYYKIDEPKAFIDDLEWFVGVMEKAVFKRGLLPPLIALSKGGYGSDLIEVQAMIQKSERYNKLKQKILNK